MDIEHISVSRKGTWDECGLRYRYRYHEKIESTLPEPFYFIYGTFVHKIAEVFVENRGEKTIGEISKDILRGKIEVKEGSKMPSLPDDYKKRLPEHLRAIQKLTKILGTDGEIEYLFKYDLDPPHQKFVTGFIDRLIIKDNKAWIIDYKTTKKGPFRKDSKSVLYDLQLRCYARVVQREFGIKPENIKAALYYLEGAELVAAKFSEESLIKAEQELLKAYNDIQASNPDNAWGNVGPHCVRCEYNNICPHYRNVSASERKIIAWDGDMENLYSL